MQPKPFASNELFKVSLARGNFGFLNGKQSVLEDPYFSLEFVMKVLEETLASEGKEVLGIRCEVIHDLTDRHKVIELASTLAAQQQKGKNVMTSGEQGFVNKNQRTKVEQARGKTHRFLLSYTHDDK